MSTGMLSAGFAHYCKIDSWLYYGLFSFFSTMAVYNGQRLFKAKSLEQTPWLAWVDKHKRSLLSLSIFCAFCAGVVFFQLPKIQPITFGVLGVSGFISTFYVLKVKGTNMRQIPHLKIHLISLSWVGVIIAFPLINEFGLTEIKGNLITISIAHYFYVLAVTIPFDIRDLKYDTKEQRTIPQVIGVLPSKVLSVVLLVIFATIMIYSFDFELIKNPIFILSVLFQIGLVIFMSEKRSDIYCAGLIDGAIALLGLSYFMF